MTRAERPSRKDKTFRDGTGRKGKNGLLSRLTPALSIGPHLFFFGLFFLFPFFYGIWINLTKWDMMGKPAFTGLVDAVSGAVSVS